MLKLFYGSHRGMIATTNIIRRGKSFGLDELPQFHNLRLTSDALRPRYWVTWLLIALLSVCAFVPLRASRWIGAGLGCAFFITNTKRRQIARINLTLCFPQLDVRQRERLLRRHFVAMGKACSDLGFLAWASPCRIERKTRLVGEEYARIWVERGRKMILLVPHCVGVNFGSVIARHGPGFSMFKPIRNPVASWFLNKGRARFGCQLLARKQGMRAVLRALEADMAFYYIPDEDFGPRRSVFTPFFGVQTATLSSLGWLSERTGAVVVPCFPRQLPGGQGYELVFKPALKNFPTGDPVKDAARMNRALQQGILEMAEQYLWTFKLFKTRPDHARSPYAGI